jgi:hypothetical protein
MAIFFPEMLLRFSFKYGDIDLNENRRTLVKIDRNGDYNIDPR